MRRDGNDWRMCDWDAEVWKCAYDDHIVIQGREGSFTMLPERDRAKSVCRSRFSPSGHQSIGRCRYPPSNMGPILPLAILDGLQVTENGEKTIFKPIQLYVQDAGWNYDPNWIVQSCDSGMNVEFLKAFISKRNPLLVGNFKIWKQHLGLIYWAGFGYDLFWL